MTPGGGDFLGGARRLAVAVSAHVFWQKLEGRSKAGSSFSMRREKQCPKCLAGRIRVLNSYLKGSVQVQRVECVRCGHTFQKQVHPDDIARRPTPRKNRFKLRRKSIPLIETPLGLETRTK